MKFEVVIGNVAFSISMLILVVIPRERNRGMTCTYKAIAKVEATLCMSSHIFAHTHRFDHNTAILYIHCSMHVQALPRFSCALPDSLYRLVWDIGAGAP